MSDEWEKEIEKATFEAGTFTDGFLDMASYSPRNAKITQAVRTEDALRIAREAFEAGKRAAFAEAAKRTRANASLGLPGSETLKNMAEHFESLAKEPGFEAVKRWTKDAGGDWDKTENVAEELGRKEPGK